MRGAARFDLAAEVVLLAERAVHSHQDNRPLLG